MSSTIPAESVRQCMIAISKLGTDHFKKYDLPRKVHKYGLQGCVKRGWLKPSDNFEYSLTQAGKIYIKRGHADGTLNLNVRLMVNSVVPPMHIDGMIGEFRKELYVGLRFPGTLKLDPKTYAAVKAAIKAGCNIELWAEAISEDTK